MSTKTDREGAEHLRFCKAAPPKANQPEALVPVEARKETDQRDKMLDARRYEVLRTCRGQEHDPLFCVRDDEGNALWGGDLDHALDDAITYEQDIYGEDADREALKQSSAPHPSPAPQAAVDAARMLTPQEILQALVAELNAGVKHTPHEIVQRKFCEVNGIAIIPATGEGAQS